MIEIMVYDTKDRKIGQYVSSIIPRENEILDANNGRWKVIAIQHDIRGSLDITYIRSFQSTVIVYVIEESYE